MTGVEFLGTARTHAPEAKLGARHRVTPTSRVAIEAINDLGLDYYLTKPWEPPAERLYPVLERPVERLAPRARRRARRGARRRPPVVGTQPRDQDVFSRANHVAVPMAGRRAANAEALRISDLTNADPADLPAGARTRRRHVARTVVDRPRRRAGPPGTSAEQPLYDLCIVGGGPRRARGRGVRRLGGVADGRRRARGARRAGGAELPHRELPRVSRTGCRDSISPQRAHRTGRAGSARSWWSRARVESFQARGSGPTRCASAARGRDRGACTAGPRPALFVPVARSAGTGRASPAAACTTARSASETRTYRDQDVYIVGARELGRNRPAPRSSPAFAHRVVLVVRLETRWGKSMSRLPRRGGSRSRRNIEVRLQSEVVAGTGGTATSRHSRSPNGAGGKRGGGGGRVAVRVHRRVNRAPTGLGDDVRARRGKGFRPSPATDVLNPTRPEARGRWPGRPSCSRPAVPGVFAAGDVRPRLDETRCVRGRRGCDGGVPRAPVPGHDLMLADELRGPLPVRIAHRRPDRAARGDRRGSPRFEAGTVLFREGESARHLLGAARGGASSSCGARSRGTAPLERDGPARGLGRRVSPPGHRVPRYLSTGVGAIPGADAPGSVPGVGAFGAVVVPVRPSI